MDRPPEARQPPRTIGRPTPPRDDTALLREADRSFKRGDLANA
jgi:hypothetical protein